MMAKFKSKFHICSNEVFLYLGTLLFHTQENYVFLQYIWYSAYSLNFSYGDHVVLANPTRPDPTRPVFRPYLVVEPHGVPVRVFGAVPVLRGVPAQLPVNLAASIPGNKENGINNSSGLTVLITPLNHKHRN